jgi:hypothetical protein
MPLHAQAALRKQQQRPPGAVTVASRGMTDQCGDQHNGHFEEETWGGGGQATDCGWLGSGGWPGDPQQVYPINLRQQPAADQCLPAAGAHVGPPVRRGTGALSCGKAAATKRTAVAQAAGGMSDGDDTGAPVDVWGSDDTQCGLAAMSKASKRGSTGAAQAAALDSNSTAAAATSAAHSMAGGTAAAAVQPDSAAWAAALQQLLTGPSVTDVKWRAILPPPSGDRVGPFTAAEMVGWLTGGKPPKGVAGAEARRVNADLGALLVCAIESKSYNPQRLPGEMVGWLVEGRGALKGVSGDGARAVAAAPGALQLCGLAASAYTAQRLPGERLAFILSYFDSYWVAIYSAATWPPSR